MISASNLCSYKNFDVTKKKVSYFYTVNVNFGRDELNTQEKEWETSKTVTLKHLKMGGAGGAMW